MNRSLDIFSTTPISQGDLLSHLYEESITDNPLLFDEVTKARSGLWQVEQARVRFTDRFKSENRTSPNASLADTGNSADDFGDDQLGVTTSTVGINGKCAINEADAKTNSSNNIIGDTSFTINAELLTNTATADDENDTAIVVDVISLGIAFNLRVVAEGVENNQQAKYLVDLV